MHIKRLLLLWITLNAVGVMVCAQGHSIEDRLSTLEAAYVEQQRAHADDVSKLRSELKERDAVCMEQQRAHADEVSMLRAELKERDDVVETLEHHVAQLTKSMFSTEGHLRSRRQTFNSDIEIAFFAKIGVNVEHLGTGQVVIFDEVVTDIDSTNSVGAYNNSSGIFTAPIDGLYVFSVTMHSLTQDSTHYGIYKNTDHITTVYIHGGEVTTTDSTSQTVVLSLRRGDSVSIRHRDADHGAFGYGHSLFSGFLLRSHGGEVEVIG